MQVLLSYFLQGKKDIHPTTTYEIESQNEVLSKEPSLSFLSSTLHLTCHTQSAQGPWDPLLGSAGWVALYLKQVKELW